MLLGIGCFLLVLGLGLGWYAYNMTDEEATSSE